MQKIDMTDVQLPYIVAKNEGTEMIGNTRYPFLIAFPIFVVICFWSSTIRASEYCGLCDPPTYANDDPIQDFWPQEDCRVDYAESTFCDARCTELECATLDSLKCDSPPNSCFFFGMPYLPYVSGTILKVNQGWCGEGHWTPPGVCPVTSSRNDISHKGSVRYGYDFSKCSPRGTPVLASANGIIQHVTKYCSIGDSSCGGGYGNNVRVHHNFSHEVPTNLYSRYGHLRSDTVPAWITVNLPIRVGTKLGVCGSTGNSTGEHIHFQFEQSLNEGNSFTSIKFSGFQERPGRLAYCDRPRSENTRHAGIGEKEDDESLIAPYTQAFVNKYKAIYSGTLEAYSACFIGFPTGEIHNSNGITEYTSEYVYDYVTGNGSVTLQNYQAEEPYPSCLSNSADGHSVLIYNETEKEAFHLKEGFLGTYKCLRYENNYTIPMGGISLLGAPTSDEMQDQPEGKCSQSTEGSTIQKFAKGCMWYNPNDSSIHVHLSQAPEDFDMEQAKADCPSSLDISQNPGPVACDLSDQCLHMGCSLHEQPFDGSRFKTPSTDNGVYYGRGDYKHEFPTSECYHLLYDSFDGLLCIADEIALSMSDAPPVCSYGSFIRVSGDSTIYRLENNTLRALCGNWSSSAFESRWGYSFDVAVLTDQEHFVNYISQYPISTNGIFAPGQQAPQCGDPGYECGIHYDPELYCWGEMDCGGCGTGYECYHGTCISTGSYCGDGNCDTTDGESCSSCPEDCGECMEIIPGQITYPANGETVDNQRFDIDWTQGYASDGTGVHSSLLCRINAGEWDVKGGFGYDPPYSFAWHSPGDVIDCKIRTRMTSNYDVWADSTMVTWYSSTDYPNIIVESVVLRDSPIPNGCNDLYIDATFRNSGNRIGDWRGRAFIHPFGEDENSANAVMARFYKVVSLEAGTSTTKEFRIDADFPLPIETGYWQITVISDDYYENIALPNRMTIDIHGNDNEPPSIVNFDLYAFEGTPKEVLPGGEHYIRVGVTDNYYIESWELDWREQGGTWQAIPMSYYPDSYCNTSDGSSAYWSVPDNIPAGQILNLRFQVWDLSGASDIQEIEVITRSHEESSLVFISPLGGEVYTRQMSSENPQCIPVEAQFFPGEPLTSITIGYFDAANDKTHSMKSLSGDDIPQNGYIDECITANETGDNIIVYIRLYDENNTSFYFYSAPVIVNYPPAKAPWQDMVIEETQHQIPRPDYSSYSSSAWGFSGLQVSGDQLWLYRKDSIYGHDYGVDKSTLKISRLGLNKSTFGLNSSEILLPSTYSEEDSGSRENIRFIKQQNSSGDFGNIYTKMIEGTCSDPDQEPCDYNFYVIEVEESALTSPQVLRSYLNREWFSAPLFGTIIRTPQNKKMLYTNHSPDGTYYTDVFRKNAQWDLIGSYSPSFRKLWTHENELHAVQKITNANDEIEWHDLILDETSGQIVSDNIIFSSSESFSLNRFAIDNDTGSTYLMVYNYDNLHLLLYKFSNGVWTQLNNQYFGAMWQGCEVSNLYPQDIMARNGHLYFFSQIVCNDSYGTHEIAVHFVDGENIDLDKGFGDIVSDSLPIAIDESGYLIRVAACEWNFEARLCLQKASETFENCYDEDPCTYDSWNPVTGQCEHRAKTCEQDGNVCNGPEVCEQTTGQCVTDNSLAITCDDGNPCNGTETCKPETGECVASNIPVIDDGISCTVDECVENTGDIWHTPDSDRCITDACHNAICDPQAEHSDAITGCVLYDLPVIPDGLECTLDSCQPDTGEPVYELKAGYCLINNTCIEESSNNHHNQCQYCDTTHPEQWSNYADATQCNDDAYCTVNDQCLAGVCVGVLRDCSIGVNDPRCQYGHCDEDQDTCIIVTAENGRSCADFDVCNGVEKCQDGVCEPGTELLCDDEFACTTNICDPEIGCVAEIEDSYCLIDNQCYENGATPQAAPCRMCVVAASQTTWTAMPDTVPCDDDDQCTYSDHCDGYGSCIGASITCENDPDVCGPQRSCNGSDQCDISYPGDDVICADAESECIYPSKCDGVGQCISGGYREDWSNCGSDSDNTLACFDGACESLGENDICEASLELNEGIQYAGTLTGFHAYWDVEEACSALNSNGPDAFFSFQYAADTKYEITVTPNAGLNVAVAVWSGCEDTKRCLYSTDRVNEGEEESLPEIVSQVSGILIIQVIDVSSTPQGHGKGFTILIEQHESVDGDIDQDMDEEMDFDTDSDTTADLDEDAIENADSEDDHLVEGEDNSGDTIDMNDYVSDIPSELEAEHDYDLDNEQSVNPPGSSSGDGGCAALPGMELLFLVLIILGMSLIRRKTRIRVEE